MYKKITHNIVEEHFDHPLATKIKQSNERKPRGGWTVYHYEDKPSYLIKATTALAKLNSRVNSIVVGISNNTNDVDNLTDQLENDISMVAELLRSDYGDEVVTAFSNATVKMFQSLVRVISAMKNDRDTVDLLAELNTDTESFSDLVASANPEYWPKDVVYQIFSTLNDLYISQVNNRIKKYWALSISDADETFDIMVVCKPDRHSFAWHFASGLGSV